MCSARLVLTGEHSAALRSVCIPWERPVMISATSSFAGCAFLTSLLSAQETHPAYSQPVPSCFQHISSLSFLPVPSHTNPLLLFSTSKQSCTRCPILSPWEGQARFVSGWEGKRSRAARCKASSAAGLSSGVQGPLCSAPLGALVPLLEKWW